MTEITDYAMSATWKPDGYYFRWWPVVDPDTIDARHFDVSEEDRAYEVAEDDRVYEVE